MPLTESQEAMLDNYFTYHAPTADQIPKYNDIRTAAKSFARVVLENTPECADRYAAISNITVAMMTANAAIARHNGH